MSPPRPFPGSEAWIRVGWILAAALLAHLAVALVRRASRAFLRSRAGSQVKAQTLASFASSSLVFVVYLTAIGFVLRQLGVSLTAYLASVSVIGFALSFGSQGLVQDVINGLTVVFTSLVDVGDVVEIGGQIGRVQEVGMRFTVLASRTGGRVFVPNRSIGTLINYPGGAVQLLVDVPLPTDETRWPDARDRVRDVVEAARERIPDILLSSASAADPTRASSGRAYLRLQLRVWPGQSGFVESTLRPALLAALKPLDPDLADWMPSFHVAAPAAPAD